MGHLSPATDVTPQLPVAHINGKPGFDLIIIDDTFTFIFQSKVPAVEKSIFKETRVLTVNTSNECKFNYILLDESNQD